MTNADALMDISPPPRPGETHPVCDVCGGPLTEGYVRRRDGKTVCWTHFLIEVSTGGPARRAAENWREPFYEYDADDDFDFPEDPEPEPESED